MHWFLLIFLTDWLYYYSTLSKLEWFNIIVTTWWYSRFGPTLLEPEPISCYGGLSLYNLEPPLSGINALVPFNIKLEWFNIITTTWWYSRFDPGLLEPEPNYNNFSLSCLASEDAPLAVSSPEAETVNDVRGISSYFASPSNAINQLKKSLYN